MRDILRSPSLTAEFHDFLAALDGDAEEGRTRQLWLEFVLSARELDDKHDGGAGDRKIVTIHLKDMEDGFFNVKDASKKISLLNPSLWTACYNLCAKAKAGSDLSPLWKASDEVIRRLDDIHQPFLLQRHEERRGSGAKAIVETIQSCLL